MNSTEITITIEAVEEILELIYRVYGYDFRSYSKASMHRRLKKFMVDANIISAAEFKNQLLNDKDVFEFLLQRITVNVTEMFRDPGFYLAMRQQVIPVLATYPIIKIWHAGCATGEEVFSMCILLHEAGLLKRSMVYATDINPANIEKAKSGIISIDSMAEYATNYAKSGGKEDFSKYYTARYENAIIQKELREQIVFSQHNLVTDQVFNEFQLVVCRNVMIYFDKNLQNRVVQLFASSLSRSGYLALGLKESLLFTDARHLFETVDQKQKIFKLKS